MGTLLLNVVLSGIKKLNIVLKELAKAAAWAIKK
tara:strand:+ start:1575 stop:1676 length:102 start_codon:yes stop_codon:yes gene_type:complete